MLEMIRNISLHKNISSNKDNNFFDIVSESDLSQSFFNQLNKYFLSKEIKFDNVFTEGKKDDDDDDKSVIYADFIINNLLNILNKKDIGFDSKNFNSIKDDKIQKKKIDKYQNNLLDTIHFLKNVKNSKKNKLKEIFEILKTKKLSNALIKNKNQINQINNVSIINNLHLKKINISNINKNKTKLIEDEKKIIISSDVKKNKNILYFSKNINKIDNIINRRYSSKVLNKKEYMKSDLEPLILNNAKNSIEWKKLISHKILLSISNKNNQAEIHLKPESLGSIHILINMNNNAAKLQFISKCNNVRTFLDGYMPFLRNSLIKNGIKLEEFNICSSLKNTELNIYKNLFYKHIHHANNCKKKFDIYEKNLDLIKNKLIDVYV